MRSVRSVRSVRPARSPGWPEGGAMIGRIFDTTGPTLAIDRAGNARRTRVLEHAGQVKSMQHKSSQQQLRSRGLIQAATSRT